MDRKLADAINEQIKNEFYSSYLYLSMAAYLESVNLEGFAHWMKIQAKEEISHAMRFFDYMTDVSERVILDAIAKPPSRFTSPLDIFQQTLVHEKKVTGMILHLCAVAEKTGDVATSTMLPWFVTEQVEEEKNAGLIVEQLKGMDYNKPGLLILDRKLARRK